MSVPLIDPDPGCEEGFRLTLGRNRSISDRGLRAHLLVIAAVSLSIAVVFAFLGAWLVLPFAGVELSALYLAFAHIARRASDYERIALCSGRLIVDVCERREVEHYEFVSAWLRIDDTPGALSLGTHGRRVRIGRHLDAQGRKDLARWLRERLKAETVV